MTSLLYLQQKRSMGKSVYSFATATEPPLLEVSSFQKLNCEALMVSEPLSLHTFRVSTNVHTC